MIFSATSRVKKKMLRARSYEAWSDAAQAHDRATGAQSWKEFDKSKLFDHASIRRRLEQLLQLRSAQDNAGLLYALNEGIHGNMDGMGNVHLHQKARFGTKQLIQDYVEAIVNSLEYLASPDVTDISSEEKLDFFLRAQHCYGRSALLLSGSGTFLYFHLGVVKALLSKGLLPPIISGSSGGSLISALVCTRSDEDIQAFFKPENLVMENQVKTDERWFGLLESGQSIKPGRAREMISKLVPDLTFQEAFELSGRHLNVSVAPAEKHQTSRLLNAIASPNVFIREAVLASCAVPGLYPPVVLAAKNSLGRRVPYLPDRKWVDGSVTNDLPTKRLARLYGVNHHIVSQANPHVTPFASDVKLQKTPIAAIRNASTTTIKAWLSASVSVMQKPLSHFPRLNSLANITVSVINQDYTGDINIIRPPILWSLPKLLSNLPVEDIAYLIEIGERTAWPKIEMVRVQTKISQTLGEILQGFEAEFDFNNKPAMKRRRKLDVG